MKKTGILLGLTVHFSTLNEIVDEFMEWVLKSAAKINNLCNKSVSDETKKNNTDWFAMLL